MSWWARAVVLSAIVEVKLRRRVPLPRIASDLGLHLRRSAVPSVTAATLSRHDLDVIRVVTLLYARLLRRDGYCLRASLVAGRLLRYRRPELIVGVRRDGSLVTAHAWLVLDGVPVDVTSPDLRARGYEGLTSF